MVADEIKKKIIQKNHQPTKTNPSTSHPKPSSGRIGIFSVNSAPLRWAGDVHPSPWVLFGFLPCHRAGKVCSRSYFCGVPCCQFA